MADVDALSRLVKKADAVAESASVLVERTIRDIRGEIANLSEELNLAGSAADREKAYAEIRRRMAKLSRRMDSLMSAQNELAGKTAAKQAAEMTGLEVKYSAKRAEAITELVTPAQGENLAAVFTDRMASSLINSLRLATVAVLREQAVEGGTMKDMTRLLAQRWREAAKTAEPKFTDASGRTWDTKTYLAMNVRTNTMRVYNDCLLDDIARTTGSDIARISAAGGDPHCVCAAWAGCVISISGKTKGLPTYEQAKNGGCFHPNCVHTLEYIDEDIDSEEIALAKAHPVQKGLEDDPDAQYERRREIDIDRKMLRDRSISRSDAELLVDRDNLTAAIRSGLIRSDARKLVDALTDAQVKALMTDNRPPRFEPTKRATRQDPHAADEIWRHGSRGGVVHIARDADAAKLIEVCNIKDAKAEWQPTTPLEKATDALMQSIGAKHTDEKLDISGVNPNFATQDFHYTNNCGRCCDAYEVRARGYKVTAKGTVGNKRLTPKGDWMQYGNGMGGGGWCEMYAGGNLGQKFGNSPKIIKTEMAKWGDGSRAKIFVQWEGGGGHFFIAEQSNGETVFKCPQSGSVYDSTIWKRVKNSIFNAFLRTDNLEFNDKISESIQV